MSLYPNFYENLTEAKRRLHQTIVCYDGQPYFVLAVADGWEDGIFRLYLEPLGDRSDSALTKSPFSGIGKNNSDYDDCKKVVESYLAINPQSNIIRKHINSPLFRKFRPYPLGFVNYQGKAIFVERMPTRRSEQGMTLNSLACYDVSMHVDARLKTGPTGVPILCEELADCINGVYPKLEDCLSNMVNPKIGNTAVAFGRNFAVVRGPIGMLFLAYKTDVIGSLPVSDKTILKLGLHHKHCREVVEKLDAFERIV